MNVLMITGDKNFSASERCSLQAAQVEKLEVVYMGPGSVWPRIPKGSFDVITVQDPFWRGIFAWFLARRTGARLNVQVHTSVLNFLGRHILRRADSIRVVSEKIKIQVESLGVRAKVSVLPVYIDLGRFQNLARQPHEQKTILWIGRFEAEKNPEEAINILQEIRTNKIDAKLIMIGAGSLENNLRRKAEGLPVEFPGWQDPVAYLAVADVVVSTSWHESYGASMIEALAAGVPVVAPDIGVAREAGVIVLLREDLAGGVLETLEKRPLVGKLNMPLLNADEWAMQWKKTLI